MNNISSCNWGQLDNFEKIYIINIIENNDNII